MLSPASSHSCPRHPGSPRVSNSAGRRGHPCPPRAPHALLPARGRRGRRWGQGRGHRCHRHRPGTSPSPPAPARVPRCPRLCALSPSLSRCRPALCEPPGAGSEQRADISCGRGSSSSLCRKTNIKAAPARQALMLSGRRARALRAAINPRPAAPAAPPQPPAARGAGAALPRGAPGTGSPAGGSGGSGPAGARRGRLPKSGALLPPAGSRPCGAPPAPFPCALKRP